jgi:hypothetical protein
MIWGIEKYDRVRIDEEAVRESKGPKKVVLRSRRGI